MQEMASSPSLLRSTIQSFLKHGGPVYRILDARARAVYLKGPRLVPSTNIPHLNLASSLFQLPPKGTAFAVLEAPEDSADSAITAIDSRAEGLQGPTRLAHDITSNPPSGTFVSASEMLRKRGWNAKWTFRDQPEFWSAFQSEVTSFNSKNDHTPQLPRIDSGRQSGKGHYHFLFQPNPFLVKVLPQIEQQLIASRCSASPEHLRCLDLGCGAGRDMTYMVARAPNNQMGDRRAEWSVVGIDEWHVACERAEQLARDTFGDDGPESAQESSRNNKGYASRISTIIGRIDPKTGVLWTRPKPSKGESRTAAPPTCLTNIQHEICQDELTRDIFNNCQEKSENQFDLIVVIRFLERAVLARMVELWLRPEGFIVWSTFVSDPDLPAYSKPGPGHRLNSKDEATTILRDLGLEIVVSEISRVEDDKRSVANVVARKKKWRSA